MPTYKMGRDCVASLPGVANDDIQDVEIQVQGEEQDVTVFGSVPVTEVMTMVTLADVTFDVTCTAHSATVGQEGAMTLAGIDSELQAVVLKVSMPSLSPKGVQTFTVSYGVNIAP